MSAHQYSEVYEDLGINLNDLGCIMLGTEQPLSDFITDDMLYYSDNPERWWINGRVEKTHLTLKYGLLPNVKKHHVDAVLKDVEIPSTVMTEGVTLFHSPYGDEDYICVVLGVTKSREILELHNQLNYLPHINTFPQYKPHITLAYIKSEAAAEALRFRNVFGTVLTTEIDYGDVIGNG